MNFVIEGGHKLSGVIRPQGAKNEALEVISACLLTDEQVTISNVPEILDVRNLIILLEGMGVKVTRMERGKYVFQADDIDTDYVASDDFVRKCAALRGSVMVVGPLLARFGQAYFPKPGGDKIGRRRVDTHITGMLNLGAELTYDETKKAFIVDPGGYAEKITDYIRENGLEPEYIILTHGHADHIGGVAAFKEAFPAIKVIAYEDEKQMLADPYINSSMDILRKPITVEADIFVTDRENLTVGDTELTFVHTPGHTKGGMCIIAPGCVFSGDTLFRASIGRTDFYGGDFGEIVDSIRNRLFCLPDDTIVYPGHMGVTNIEYEKRNNPFV